MNYLEIVGLSREPFSNSPDPECFYPAEPHQLCLNRLEIALRLKRGLNIVYGPVGSGKSTLCRALFARLRSAEGIAPHLLLDAEGGDVLAFVRKLLELMGDSDPAGCGTVEAGVGRLESLIFETALKKGVTPVLLLDEGQKLTPGALEVLRVLLNFETNTEKLLQIVIFAQPEFRDTIQAMPNFADRVNEEIDLRPMTEEESMKMIRHRLSQAGSADPEKLFSRGAMREIHRLAAGHPRRMVRLAHLTLLALIMGGGKVADAKLVRAQAARISGREPAPKEKGRGRAGLLAAGIALALFAAGAAMLLVNDDARGFARRIASRGAHAVTAMLEAPQARTEERNASAASSAAASTAPASAGQKGQKTPAAGESKAAEPTKSEKSEKDAKADPAAPAQSAAPHPYVNLHDRSQAAQGASASTGPAAAPEGAAGSQAAPAASPQVPSDAARIFVNIPGHLPLEELAELVYSDPRAADPLRRANPRYDETEGQNLVELPLIEYAAPATLTRNFQLAFGVWDTAQEALDALESLEERAPGLSPRFVMRSLSGRVRFALVARVSFRDASRAWAWLSGRKVPADLEPRILPPYGPLEPALAAFESDARILGVAANTAGGLDHGR